MNSDHQAKAGKARNRVILAAPGLTIGEAIKAAGQQAVFAKATDSRSAGRARTAGCPGCAIDSRALLRSINSSLLCRACHVEANN